MGDTENTKKAPKKSFWKGLKAEYKRQRDSYEADWSGHRRFRCAGTYHCGS